ncbi:MAG: malonyl-CoA synthase [Alphaproteobacteria bacterium]|nr:malonyl-CoA synthase [Alphaproteobacteria bacterium]
MFEQNHLLQQFNAIKIGHEDSLFAKTKSGGELTYGQLYENAFAIAAHIQKMGVVVGDRIVVQAPKSLTVIETYLACLMSGAIFIPLNTAYTLGEVSYFLEDAKPKIFICDADKVDSYETLPDAIKPDVILCLDADGKGSFIENLPDATEAKIISRKKDDIAAILYTSGTTGRSKGAMLSHENLWSNAQVLRDLWRFQRTDTLIHALPIFHAHGLFVAINVTLATGSSLLFHQKFDVEDVLNDLPDATVLMGVPTFYTRLLQEDRLTKNLTENMRLFISGSAPLLADTHHQFEDRTGHRILERYGMTETGMNSSNPYEGERRAGTVGFPLPGTEILITDQETGTPLPNGEIGSLEIRGPNVFKGYWQMPEKTKEEIRENGFFISGDLARIDEDGYITIVGRSKDLIISGGYNIYPKELELVIDEFAEVDESAVIGVPHPDFGETVIAILVAKPDTQPDLKKLENSLSESLASFKRPRKLILVDELPRNTMGKVQKNLLRQTYQDLFK